MSNFSTWRKRIQVALLATGGAIYQVPGAGCAQKVARNVNPCGTILVCEPIEYEYAVGNFDPFEPDFEACPISVFVADCAGGVFPPITGGGGDGDGNGNANGQQQGG
jgi:hypothetical protein